MSILSTQWGRNFHNKRLDLILFFLARGTTRCCKSCSYGYIHMPKKNNQRRRRVIIYYWQLTQRSWFWFWAEWREKLYGNGDDVSQRCLKFMFSVLSRKAGLLQEGRYWKRWIWCKTATLIWSLFIYYYFFKGEPSNLSNREGGWKNKTVCWTGGAGWAGWAKC